MNKSKTSDYKIEHSHDHKKNQVTYNILNEDNTPRHSLRISEHETCYPYDIHNLIFNIEKENKSVSSVNITLDDNQPSMNMGTADGIMMAYKELALYQNKDHKKDQQLILSFLDTYVFNTPESREVLQEVLSQPTASEIKQTEQKNEEAKRNIKETIQSENTAEARKQYETQRKKDEKEKAILMSSISKEILKNRTH